MPAASDPDHLYLDYRCLDCDVEGRGTRCWCCGRAEKLRFVDFRAVIA